MVRDDVVRVTGKRFGVGMTGVDVKSERRSDVAKQTMISTANGNLEVPAHIYKVKGNMIEVRRPLRKVGDALSPIPYSRPFVPHVGQKPIWFDLKTRHQIMLAGSQGGKSHIGPIWMWREIERTLATRTEGVEYLFGVIGPTLQM